MTHLIRGAWSSQIQRENTVRVSGAEGRGGWGVGAYWTVSGAE